MPHAHLHPQRRIGYVLVLTPNLGASLWNRTEGALVREVYMLTMALGEALHRTPLLVLQPPTLDQNGTAHFTQPHCYDMRQLQSCNGSFLSAAFLRGHLYLNRSLVPRWEVAKWRHGWGDVWSDLETAVVEIASPPTVGSPAGRPPQSPLPILPRSVETDSDASPRPTTSAADDTLLIIDLAPSSSAPLAWPPGAPISTGTAHELPALRPTLEKVLRPSEPPTPHWALSLVHAMTNLSASSSPWRSATNGAHECASRVFDKPLEYSKGVMRGCPRARVDAPKREALLLNLVDRATAKDVASRTRRKQLRK